MGTQQTTAHIDERLKKAFDRYCSMTKKQKSQFTAEALLGRAMYLYGKAEEILKKAPKEKFVVEMFEKELEALKGFKVYQEQLDLIEDMVHDHSRDEIEAAINELWQKSGVK